MKRVPFLQSDRLRALLGLATLLLAIGAWRAGALPRALDEAMTDIANSGLSERDIELVTQNYYEVLMDVDHLRWMRGGLVGILAKRVRAAAHTDREGNWVLLAESDLVVRDDEAFLNLELKPNYETIYMGVPVRTNRWQMRDRDYEQTKPPGTFRIALVGSSNDMGYGVPVQQIYPELLEERLNAELAGQAFERYEVLNFSVGGYQLLHRLYVADVKVPPFEPDLILIVATMHDLRWSAYELLVNRVFQGRDLHYDFLRDFAAAAKVETGQSKVRIAQRIRPRRVALVKETFAAMRRVGEREGVPVVLCNFRLRVDPIDPEMIQQGVLAQEAGLPAIEVFDAYEGHTGAEMYLTPTDLHPSVAAHALLADELYEDLLASETTRDLLLGKAM